jgi:cation diffusion facilitator CzcD-associated flavoprotein CzcO
MVDVEKAETHVDVLIVGAGLSGIGAAARLERDRPGTSYAVLEQRQAIGGTWDLFRYPGVRSDTDMYTFSYPFRPWSGAKSMGDGEDIRGYIRNTAVEYDIERHITFGATVRTASWSSGQAAWRVCAEVNGRSARYSCSFLYLCTGYYDYSQGHQPDFAGLEDYRGTFCHPQFWPEELDYTGKKVVVIGSGATAITVIPAMADDAEHVTMLQRSPSYVGVVPETDAIADALRRWLPSRLAHHLLRVKNTLFIQGIYSFSRNFPRAARKLFRRTALRFLGDADYVDRHFKPYYRPWEQRLTVAPDGDFFRAIRHGKASVVTEAIDRFVPEGIRLASGETLEADVVISATGLSLKRFGGMELDIDGEPVDLPATTAYRAVLLSGVPNLAFCFGYTNQSWTLRADVSSRFVCRLLAHMERHGYTSATPVADPDQRRYPFITDLTSGYIQRGIDQFPAQGEKHPWLVRQNYMLDTAVALSGDVSSGMHFARDGAREGTVEGTLEGVLSPSPEVGSRR